MVKLFKRTSNSSSGSSGSKSPFEKPHFSKQCFIVTLVICSNAWFTRPRQCRRSTLWIISDAFFSSLILQITYFKNYLPYLTLKFRMISASQGCNWEVVFLGKNTSLMFLRFRLRVQGEMEPYLETARLDFRLLVYGLRRWEPESGFLLSSMLFSVKILHTIWFRTIRQFSKASRNFTLSNNNRFTYLEDAKSKSSWGHKKFHSKSLL